MRDLLWVLLGVCGTLAAGMACEQGLIWLLRPARHCGTVTLLPVAGECPSLERQLRWQYFCMQSHPCRRGERLLIVDCGATDNALHKAELFCRDRPGVMICTPEGLRRMIGNDAIYKAIALVLY
ncbi:hypothetical protein DSECCO2_599660 [anaerobic digester metagenome]